MYQHFFGLNTLPFGITPDTGMFFAEGKRAQILQAVMYSVLNGDAITKVTGEVGSGKTMLCRMLELRLPPEVQVVYLMNPSLSAENVVFAIAHELGLTVSAQADRFQVLKQLESYLIDCHRQEQRVVIFVEEAQRMPITTLEEIRLLTNLETQHDKLLQIVLFGQPELDVILSRREVRQIKERIINRFDLPKLNYAEIRRYLTHRLHQAGAVQAASLFSPGAVRLIAWLSQGLMRRINLLADKALLAAYVRHKHSVGVSEVLRAYRDCVFSQSQRLMPARVRVAAIGGPLCLLTAWLVLAGWESPDATERAQQIQSQALAADAEVKDALKQLAPGRQSPASAPVVTTVNAQTDLTGTRSGTAPQSDAVTVSEQALFAYFPRPQQLPQHGYAIQLFKGKMQELVWLDQLLAQADHARLADWLQIYRATEGGPVKVIIGPYSSISEARKAQQLLPEQLTRKWWPYVRQLRSIQTEQMHN